MFIEAEPLALNGGYGASRSIRNCAFTNNEVGAGRGEVICPNGAIMGATTDVCRFDLNDGFDRRPTGRQLR